MVAWTCVIVFVVVAWAAALELWPQLSPAAAVLQQLASFGQRTKDVVASVGSVLGAAHPFIQAVGEACGQVPSSMDAVHLCTDAVRSMGAAVVPPACVLATDLLALALDLWTGFVWAIQQVSF